LAADPGKLRSGRAEKQVTSPMGKRPALSSEVFDRFAERYDAWFDSPEGKAIFQAEVECLRRLLPHDLFGWVEVGVGTGRFAAALGVPEGVDPLAPMLEKARPRGVRTREASAEGLPYPSASLNGILLVVTLCFLDQPENAMGECARVLKAGGQLLVGIVPADSPWGRFYQGKAEEGHPFYSVARFYTCRETKQLAATAGFEFVRAASTLPAGPGDELANIPVLDDEIDGCGFVAMLFSIPAQKGDYT